MIRRKTQDMAKDVDYTLAPGKRLRVVDVADSIFVARYVRLTNYASEYLQEELVRLEAPMLSYKLFIVLACDLKFGNESCVPCYVPLLARRFGVSGATIYDVRKALLRAGVMRRVQKHIVLMNPYLVFAGDNRTWSQARKRWDEGIVKCDRIAVVVEQLMEMERQYEEEKD